MCINADKIVPSRQCASDICEGNNIYEALLPSGPSINLVLKKVWTLWEDPVDVSVLFRYINQIKLHASSLHTSLNWSLSHLNP